MNNKENIAAIALSLFSQKGYEAVGIQEIVETSGVTKPTLYHYFGSKEGLLSSILEECFAGFFAFLRGALVYRGDIPLLMQDFVYAFLDYIAGHEPFFRLMLSLDYSPVNSVSYRAIYPFMEKYYALFVALFENVSADHGNMKGKARSLAVSLLGLLHTYAILVLNRQVELTRELGYHIAHQYMHGIFS